MGITFPQVGKLCLRLRFELDLELIGLVLSVFVDHSLMDDIISLSDFIVTELHGRQITPGLGVINMDTAFFVIKDGDTCCTNPSLSNA